MEEYFNFSPFLNLDVANNVLMFSLSPPWSFCTCTSISDRYFISLQIQAINRENRKKKKKEKVMMIYIWQPQSLCYWKRQQPVFTAFLLILQLC